MAPIQHNNNHGVSHETHAEGHESNSLIVKLYSQILTNQTVQVCTRLIILSYSFLEWLEANHQTVSTLNRKT